MSFAYNGETRIYYECFGQSGDPPILLLNGAGRQCVDFDEGFCNLLSDGGYRVIRYDSRDTGLSSDFSHHPARLIEVSRAISEARRPELAYDLDDMARDALAVLDAADARVAHFIGRSLGGMTAQRVAIRSPKAVLSLSLIMANSRSVSGALTPEYLERIEREVISSEDEFVARQLRTAKVVGAPLYLNDARVEAEARIAFRRGVHPGAIARHFAVALAAPDLRPDLARVTAPTLIIHGALDPLIPVAFAKETAEAIPGARMEVLDDMAHDAPPEIWRRWASLVLGHLNEYSSVQ